MELKKKHSNNIRRNCIRAIFEAQKSIQALIRRALSINIAPLEHHVARTYTYAFIALLVFGISVQSVLGGYGDTRTRPRTETINIIPGIVSGNGWENLDTIQVQDVSEDGLYQAFDRRNAAYPSERDSGSRSSVPREEVQSTVPPATSGDATPQPTDDVTPTSDVEATPTDVGSETVEEAPTALGDAFHIFARIRDMLPFAQESIVEEVESGTQPIVEDVPLTETVPPPDVQDDSTSRESTTPGEQGNEEVSPPIVDEGSGATSIRFTEEPIVMSDFGIAELTSGQLISNVQLRLSFGAHMLPDDAIESLVVEYTFGGTWVEAGSIVLDGEVSNALNGGYFLFALPNDISPDDLSKLQVRLRFDGTHSEDDDILIDALWLEVDTEVVDEELFAARLLPEHFEGMLAMPEKHTLLNTSLDFARTESPQFVLRYTPQRNAVINFFRSIFSDTVATIASVTVIRKDGGVADVSPTVNETPDGLWTIQLGQGDTEELQPGTYSVLIEVNEGGKLYTDTFEFQWGLIALNPDKTEYAQNETAYLSLAALSQNGNTVCDADLALYIINPEGYITRAPVHPSGLCNGNNIIDRPDYTAEFTPDMPGTYEMYVEHVNSEGEVLSHTRDTFIVVPSQTLSLRRMGPTRIYPPALYPMELTVAARDGFVGTLVEHVPLNFIVYNTDARITERDGVQELSWDLTIPVGGTSTVSYSFDAPDISPYLYTLGPAEIRGAKENVIVTEVAPQEGELLVQESLITPIETGDTPLSPEESQSPIVEDAPPSATEATSHTDTTNTDGVVVEETPEGIEEPTEEDTGFVDTIINALFGGDENENPPTPTEVDVESPTTNGGGILDTVIDSLFGGDEIPLPDTVPITDTPPTPLVPEVATTTEPVPQGELAFSEHRQWQIASDATGNMLLYWASTTIPSGWTCVSCQATDVFYQRFIMGSSSPGINGGTTTHTHTATGAVSPTTTTGVSSAAGGTVDTSIASHGHTYSPIIASANHLPPYRNLVVIQSNVAGSPATIPANAIALFDTTVPSGWIRYAPQDGNYLRGESTTTIGTTGGSLTHTHSITGTTGSSDTNTNGPGAAGVTVATDLHTHTVSTTTVALNHEPPYREVILGKLTATSSPTDAMIAMWTDTPPSGWSTMSSTSEPFANRFAKASTTYGGTGGASTTTHPDISNVISSGASATAARTAGGTSDAPAHTHYVNITNFSSATTLPPYRTAIFAKRGVGGALPDAPTVHVLFDNEKTGTSTPRLEFTGLDIDGADTLVYQVEWDDDKDIATSPLGSRTSDNEVGCSPNCFTNTASTTDTNPFTENERIRFTIQSGLVSGSTYYWRVRVKETVGDTWSAWSAVQSFTYESGTSPSEWFQTEGSQFEGGTRVNVSTTTGDVVLSSTTLTQLPVLQSGWTNNTAAAAASLTLTKPSGVEVGDLLLILVGNDNNTATAQWDDISLRPTGFSMINEAGNNTPDTHVAAFYKIADGTETATTSVPAQGTNNFWGFYIRVTGASTTNPINVVGSDYAVNNLTNHPIPSVTTTVANTLAFYMLAGDAVGTAPFSVSGTGWAESDEITINTAGTWGTRSMSTAGATGDATVTMNASDGASGFQFAINPSSAFGTLVSPEVDFDVVPGQSQWGEIAWSGTEPANTSAKVRLYYSSTTACDTLVPESSLSGNSAGFSLSASPVTITNFSTSTYNRLCLKATLQSTDGVSSPTLTDWTVRWRKTPQFTQSDYLWYANTDALLPTDPWPVGASDLDENQTIESSDAVLRGDTLRLRMSVTATSTVVSTSSVSFALQYAEGDTCSASLSWQNVGDIASTTALWRGYNNGSVSDGVLATTTLLTNTTVSASYEEENDSALNLRSIPIGGVAEWDWVLYNNLASHGTTYCFRMVKTGGVAFNGYTNYPTVTTNASPGTFTLYTPFDNEKISSTTPYFEFNGIDPESNDISYQIQIDDDYTFGSVNIDRNTVSNPTLFDNLATPSDKDPYTNGERIRFSVPGSSPLSNGTTYYWRVRGQDPVGSNEWGSWSTVYSVTIDTSVTVSTWFQTTEEQFDTGTYEGTEALGTDLVSLISGSTTGTTTSSAITFTNGTRGNAWGSLSWTDNESVGDIKYRLQYYDTAVGAWSFIPDSVLSGNSTGFDTSSVSLLDIDTDMYGVIRVIGVFTNSGGSPTLSDWTISWGYRIETPTINAPFRNEKVSTTTPTFEFYTTDPQGDDLEYEIQWSTTSAFTASTTRTSTTSAGFANITNGGDTNPFTSGHVIQFTVQAGDALTNGRTYWWRVRARDPFGSNQYSFYTDEQSFTVDTSVTVSTWFQTTAEQFVTDTLSGLTTQSTTSVTVATTSVESLMGYAEGTVSTPRYRIWDGSVWGSEGSAQDVGAAIMWVVTKAAPNRNEYIMATLGTDADVNVQVYANGTWENLQELTNSIPNTNMRGFDVAYEQTSGDALAVTCDGDTNPSYWIWDGTNWTNGGSVGTTLGTTCGWVKLISDPTSDEIIAVVRDTGGVRYEARVWNGSSWGNSATLGSMAQPTHEGIAAEYEDSGNQAVIAVSNGGNASFQWRAWDGTTATWTATATVAIGDDFEAGNIRADDGTDNMIFCYVDEDGDVGVQRWTGAGFAAGITELSTAWATAGNIYNDRPIDCLFETNGSRDGYITALYSTTTAMASSTYVAAWTASQRISPAMSASGVRVALSRTGSGLIQAVSYASTTDRYEYTDWNGSSWSAVQVLESNAAAGATPYKEPFMIAPKNPVTSGSIVGDPLGIDFYAGSGPYWQQMSWTDTTAGGSDILYQVEYYDGDSWELIPNSLIPGNSTGTTTSPINLTNVLPVATYNLIRPVATFTCNLGTCPVLQDWTITWSAGITISGTARGYDKLATTTSGTVAVALDGVLQTGKTGTISNGVWSIANVNASPGDIVTVFINGANDANEAVAVARYDGVGDMSGLQLFDRHLTLGSNDATTTAFTNAEIGQYDVVNDEDVFFDLTGTTLSLCATTGCGDARLYVASTSVYRPSGTVSVHDIENNGTLQLDGNTFYVSGSWDNNATTTSGTSTVVFTATSTSETIDGTGGTTVDFYNVTMSTTTSTATWTLVTPLDVNNAFILDKGTLARGTTSITVGGNFTIQASGTITGVGTTTFDGTGTSILTDATAGLQNIGRVVIDGTSKTIQEGSGVKVQSLTIGSDDIYDVSTSNFGLTVLTNFINNNTFVARSGTTTFAGTTTNLTINTGSNFYNLTFTGAGGSWSFVQGTLSVGNDFSIATGTVTLPTGTTTITGSFQNATGTFAHNNGTVVFNTSGTKTVRQAGSGFNNAFYNVLFSGTGSYSFLDTHATTSNDFRITQGSVTFPSGVLSVGGAFENTAGTFSPNNGTVRVFGTSPNTMTTNSSFYNLLFSRSSTTSFTNTNVTSLEDVTVSTGTVTFPSGTFTIGGSLQNTATITPNGGTVLMNSTDTGEVLALGNSSLANLTFNSGTGGWTITQNATTTGSTTITSVGQFTLNSGLTLSVGGVFTNTALGASTTWTGSTLSLESGAYTINTKSNTLESYGTLRVKANTDIKMWNATATTYTIDTTGSLYSQDHNGVDGSLYIFSEYVRSSGTEYWSYDTDFDGTSLGSTSRAVDVRIASSSSITLSSSTLILTGTTTGTTTVRNQGVGAYRIDVQGGTTTMSFYNVIDLGTTGLTLASSTKVTSMNDGRFVPSVSGGRALSVSSTTIDANPALQIYRVNFSTTSAISAFNVAQTGGTSTSYWWFRSSTGTIDGEAFDSDTGDPGTIRWDDSSLVITVSGTVYGASGTSTLGVPTCGAGTPVRVVVGGGGSVYDGACNGSGVYSIPGVTIVGDQTLTVFLNGASGGERAVTITKTPTGSISGFDLIVGRVITRHQDVTPLSIADMANYDSTDDSDIPFTAATGTSNTLTVQANNALYVWATSTFTPGGSVTLQSGGTGTAYDGTLYLGASSTFTGAGTTTYAIGGSLSLAQGATFTPASTTVLMTATTTGKTITAASNTPISLNLLSFTGVGGGWNVNSAITVNDSITLATGTVTGTGDITVQNGSFSGNGLLSLGSGTTTLVSSNTLGGSQAWTFGNLVLGTGSITGTTSKASVATTTILGKLTIGTAHFFNAFGSILELRGSGTVFVENGTFVEGTSTVRYSGTTGSNVLGTGYYNLDIGAQGQSPTYTGTGLGIQVSNALTIGGATTTTFTLDTSDPAMDVNGTTTIMANGTLVGSNSGVFTQGSSWINNGTFTPSGGTLTFDGSGSTSIQAGASSFSSVSINGSGTFTLTGNATATNAFTLTSLGGFTVPPSVTLAVGTTFTNNVGGVGTTWANSTLYLYGGANYSINGTSTQDVYGTLALGTNTHIRMWNSSAATTTFAATSSLYSQDHAGVDGELYIYGTYPKTSGTDYWTYATDFDGATLGVPRQVNVRIASGTSLTYTGGGLSVMGVSSASTTIQNQGSGTYAFRIGGTASTTWNYYDVRHMNASGIVFSGSPTVNTLSYGRLTVGVASGTALTVGGTAIDQNPARTFTQNIFSTSTGGLAFNVTATGTSISSWRFTNHSGEIDGEAYDVDPNGDPGYVVWDDSSANITIAGRVYQDEGSTVSTACTGTTTDITLRVAGLTTYQTSCNAGTGAYSISGVIYSPGDSFVVYIDGRPERGATVSEDPVTSIANFDIYENRVIVRHESSDPLSIADMAVWDSSDDADIPFTAVTGSPNTLTLPQNTKLVVWTGKEFEPNGNMTLSGGGAGAAYDGTLELYQNAIFDAQGTESHAVGGSFIMGTGAVFNRASTTFTFTTTGAGRTIDTNDQAFYGVTMNGPGSWTVTNTAFDVVGTLTITQGTVTFPTGTTTITGSLLNTGGAFVQNGGSMLFNATSSRSIRTGTSTLGTTTFNGAGSWTYLDTNSTTTGDVSILSGTLTAASGTLTIGGNFTNGATFIHNSGTLRMNGTRATTTVNASTSDLGSVVVSVTGALVFTDPSEALQGSLTLLSGTTTLPTSTVSIGRSLLEQGGRLIHSTGTVLMNASVSGNTISVPSSTLNNLTIAAPSGGYTITSNATTTGNFTLSSANSFTLQSGNTLTVGGVFTNLVGGATTTWTGSTLKILTGTNYTANTKTQGGDIYNNLVLGNNTDLRLWNSAATTTLLDTVSSLYSQNNAGVNGELYIYGDYTRTTGTDYWSATTDFDGSAITARAVTVRHAPGATTTLSGGSLEIIGTASATTTVTNQGSGTYSLQATGGTLNAQYYAFRNLNVFGLVLTGTTTAITTLQNGDFELAVSGGTLITLASSTLAYNASAVIGGVRFATTTAITGVNVAVVGTTSAAWTFTGHRGNLAGESYDSDGGDACGSVRWDDSTCLLTEQSAYRWRNDNGGEGVPDSEWYDTNWSKRKRVTVRNLDATTYTNAVVEVTVPYDSDMQSDFDDIRVTDSSGTTTLNFTRETYTASTQAVIWVKVPSLLASASTEVYVYYGNGAATYGGVGTTTFAVYDDYEDGSNSEYSGDTSKFVVNGTFAYQGSYGVKANSVLDRTTDGIYRTSASSTISQGQTVRFFQYIDTSAGPTDETCTMFGVQGNQNNNYAVCLEQVAGTDRMSISRDVDDNDQSGTILSSTTVAYSTGWYEVEVDWATNNTIFASLYKNNVLIATTTASDSTYTSGGFGYTYWFQSGGWDYYTARTLLTSEPTTTIGFEQVRGGASWAAARNTLLSGASVGTVVRPRFLIENTGLTVSDQYRLMYAPKGASPSCEAVSSGSYSAVPVYASCGSSPVCMATSSQFTNNASTTDLLGGEGTFAEGQIIEDPSNTTNSLSLSPNTFTEVEYAIRLTSNATSPSYCFRVSDAGTSIDSYTKVAELGLVFAPSISSITFNNGADITLNPGGTTTIYATGTVSDQNGYSDIAYATTTMYRSGVGSSCTQNQNNCYIAGPASCSYSSCSGNSCEVTCRADFYYFADPTDTGSAYDAESWGAMLSVRDQSGLTASQTAPFVETLTLRALSATDPINYGSLEVNTDTGATNASTTFTNLGNSPIDVLIEGTNLTDGVSSIIPVTTQKYATTTFTYSACTFCSSLTASSTSYEVDLVKPTTTTSIIDDIFWGISIPYGVSAKPHQGTNTFYATGD